MNTKPGDSHNTPDHTHRVVIVIGQPDHTLVASLGAVGLTPVAEDGEVVIWGKPSPSPRLNAARPPEVPAATSQPSLLMTIADAAHALGIGRSTVYELISQGELDVVHVGRSARVPTETLRALVERLRADQEPRRWPRAAG
jgi:excisionase family DNA binding protein